MFFHGPVSLLWCGVFFPFYRDTGPFPIFTAILYTQYMKTATKQAELVFTSRMLGCALVFCYKLLFEMPPEDWLDEKIQVKEGIKGGESPEVHATIQNKSNTGVPYPSD